MRSTVLNPLIAEAIKSLKFALDMVKMYLHTKNEVSMSRGSKVTYKTDRNTDRQTDRQTDRHTHTQTHTHTHTDMTENITYPHTRVVKIITSFRQ